jgi:hypothetical protein
MFEAATDQAANRRQLAGMQSVKKKHQANH